MKRWWIIPSVGVLLVLTFLALPGPARPGGSKATGAPEPKAAATPNLTATQVSDPAFARYTDLALLLAAWEKLDSTLFTDVVLQLAEGERILLRSHKSGISAAQLLPVAIKLAAENRDAKSLDRLARVAALSGGGDAEVQIAMAKKLASAPRAATPALQVSVEDTAPSAVAAYQCTLNEIRSAKLTGDRKALLALNAALAGVVDLTDAHRKALKKVLAEAIQAADDGGAVVPLPRGAGNGVGAAIVDARGNEISAIPAGDGAWQTVVRCTLHNATSRPVEVSFHGAGRKVTLKADEKGSYTVYGPSATEVELQAGAPGPTLKLFAGPGRPLQWVLSNANFRITDEGGTYRLKKK